MKHQKLDINVSNSTRHKKMYSKSYIKTIWKNVYIIFMTNVLSELSVILVVKYDDVLWFQMNANSLYG